MNPPLCQRFDSLQGETQSSDDVYIKNDITTYRSAGNAPDVQKAYGSPLRPGNRPMNLSNSGKS